MPDHYKILGVEPDATPEDIQKAYRARANRWHPDKWCAEPEPDRAAAEKKFRRIQTAYELLKDPERRKEYDVTRPRELRRSIDESDSQEQSRVMTYAADVARELREAIQKATQATTTGKRRFWKGKQESWERSLDPIIAMYKQAHAQDDAEATGESSPPPDGRSPAQRRRRFPPVAVAALVFLLLSLVVLVVLALI